MREDGKLCELCLLEEGTVKHKTDECQKLETIEFSIEDKMKDQSDQKGRKVVKRGRKKQGKVQKRKRGNGVI